MGNSSSNANNPNRASPLSWWGGSKRTTSASASAGNPHRSLRTKKKSLELPDLASLSLASYKTSPRRGGGPIPIPTNPQDPSNHHVEAQGARTRVSLHPLLRPLARPSEARGRPGFVPEVVQSSIPIVIGKAAWPTEAAGLIDSLIKEDLVSDPVPVKTVWRGARADDNESTPSTVPSHLASSCLPHRAVGSANIQSMILPSPARPSKPPPLEFTFGQSNATSGMFEHAHDLSITGGQFYSVAGGMSINTSQDASTHLTGLTYVAQHFHVSNHVALSGSSDERLESHTRGDENDDLCRDSAGQVGMREECADDDLQCSNSGNLSSDNLKSSDSETESDDSEPENYQLHPTQISAPSSPSFKESLFDSYFLLDEAIIDILSSYPPPPTGDPHSFQRILVALLFSFSPLSLPVLAALLGFDGAEHVNRILLPASLFVLIPDLRKNEGDLEDRALVRFVDSSITDFFVDQTRSKGCYIDSHVAHKVLLDACTWVMGMVYTEERSLKRQGWRGAYEYACQNWERHRCAVQLGSGKTRGKL